MLTAGIDIGSKNIKMAILKDDKELLAMTSVYGRIDQQASAQEVLKATLQEVKVKRSDLGHIVSTGAGRKSAPYITGDVLEVVAYCRAMVNRIFELLFRLGIERKNIL